MTSEHQTLTNFLSKQNVGKVTSWIRPLDIRSLLDATPEESYNLLEINKLQEERMSIRGPPKISVDSLQGMIVRYYKGRGYKFFRQIFKNEYHGDLYFNEEDSVVIVGISDIGSQILVSSQKIDK